MSPPLLVIDHVSKKFGYRAILEDLHFEVRPGEFILLLGNNGAGKTTLLQIISSLMKANAGKVLFKGQDTFQHRKTLLESMGYISHASRLYEELTAVENLRLFGALYAVADLEQRIHQVLSEVALEHAARLPVRTFSRGMVKRLMIARVSLYRPELLLLDEPYTGLDVSFVKQFQNYLRDYQLQGGTVLMTTHQLELGLALATRGLVLKNKKIRYDVPASEMDLDQCSLWLDTC